MRIDCAFSRLHPFVLLLWFVVLLFVTVLTVNPIFVALSFICAVISRIVNSRELPKLKSVLSHLLFMVAIALINPLVSHHGVTTLFFLNDLPITLEALLFGVLMSFIVTAALMWCSLLSTCMTSDKVICIFGRFFPRLAVLISLTLRFIPLIKEKYKAITDAQIAFRKEEATLFERIRDVLTRFSALVTMVLEDSIDISDSMRARGSSLKGRTSYSDFTFRTADVLTLLLVFAAAAYMLTARRLGSTFFVFYPVITKLPVEPIALASYAAFCILALIPTFMEVSFWKRSGLTA